LSIYELPILVKPADVVSVTGLSRRELLLLEKAKVLSVFRTTGNQRRFYRDEIIKLLKEQKNGNNR
jgi:DNA-binding transcriptional MerR regulator